jgi:hypothetical protein
MTAFLLIAVVPLLVIYLILVIAGACGDMSASSRKDKS